MSFYSLPPKHLQVSEFEANDAGQAWLSYLLSIDIYSPHVKNHEIFPKTGLNRRGDKHGGILFEEDPVRHRRVAKQVALAFSSRATKAKEPRLHRYIDSFVNKMNAAGHDAVDVSRWLNWLAMDMSADIIYNREMQQVTESE